MGKSARNANSVNRLDALTVATVAEAKALDVLVGTVVETQGYTSSGDGGANRYVVVAGGTGTDDGGSFIDIDNGNQLEALFPAAITAEMFGAKADDGVTDNYSALQTILDLGIVAELKPKGLYGVTQTLLYKRGGGFYSVSPDARSDLNQVDFGASKAAVIKWTGAATTDAVIRASATDIGVPYVSAFEDTILGGSLQGVVIDANNLADYGMYVYRAGDFYCKRNFFKNANKHGFYATGIFRGVYKYLVASQNNGCGITFGRGQLDFGFSISQLNAVNISGLRAVSNGADKQFDLDTNPAWGYGIGIWCHRGNFISGILSEYNDGANFYIAPTSYANKITQLYSELGNSLLIGGTSAIDDGRAPHKIGMIFDSYGVGSYGNKIDALSLAGEHIHLIGTAPSDRVAERNVFEQVSGGDGLTAAWSQYRLVDCNQALTTNITGSFPAELSGALNDLPAAAMAPLAMVVFRESPVGTIVIDKSYNVGSVNIAGTGDYIVNFTTNAKDDNYGYTLAVADNRIAGKILSAVGSFRFRHRGSGGALTEATDGACLTIWQ